MNRRVGGRGYSLDLRERIVEAVLTGTSRAEVAAQFQVHLQTVELYLIKHHLGTLGRVRSSTGRPRRVTPEHEHQLLQQLEAQPDGTLADHAQMLQEATGLQISSTTVHRVFERAKITYKKNAGRLRAE